MKRSQILAFVMLSATAVLPAAAQDRYPQREPYRGEYHDTARDLRHDYRRIEHLRAEIARDRARIDEDMRRGHYRAADRHSRDLDRHQRELAYLLHDAHEDRESLGWDYRR